MSEDDSERRRLTTGEKVVIREIGGSYYVRISKKLASLQILKNKLDPLTKLDFYAEIDKDGIIYLIFEREKTQCQPK